MKRCFEILIFFLFGVGMMFLGHEQGYMDGQQYQKFLNNEKLQSCNKIIAGSLYER